MSAEPMEIPHAFRDFGARIAVVLGSGLASFADGVEIEAELDYADIAGHPIVGVPGHAGRYLAAKLGAQPIVIADGRVHLYEGYSAREAAHPVQSPACDGYPHDRADERCGDAEHEFPARRVDDDLRPH